MLPDKSIKPIKCNTDYVNCHKLGSVYDNIIKHELSVINYDLNWKFVGNKIYKYKNDWCEPRLTSIKNIKLKIKGIASFKDESELNTVSSHVFDLIKGTNLKALKAKNFFANYIKLKAKNNWTILSPDIIIDDRLIDIKTYNKICLNKDDLIQLVMYALWVNNTNVIHGPPDTNSGDYHFYKHCIKINEIGIFFSKHNYLWSINLNEVVLDKHLSAFNEIIYENINNESVKTTLRNFTEMYFIKFISDKIGRDPVKTARKKKYNIDSDVLKEREKLFLDKIKKAELEYELNLSSKISLQNPPTPTVFLR